MFTVMWYHIVNRIANAIVVEVMKTEKKAMTVRLPLDLYRASAQMASRRQVSLSGLVQESLRATLERERRRQLYQAFSRVGEDMDETDVQFAFDAQAQVVRDGES